MWAISVCIWHTAEADSGAWLGIRVGKQDGVWQVKALSNKTCVWSVTIPHGRQGGPEQFSSSIKMRRMTHTARVWHLSSDPQGGHHLSLRPNMFSNDWPMASPAAAAFSPAALPAAAKPAPTFCQYCRGQG